MITPESLKRLAEGMGKDVHTDDIAEHGRLTIKQVGFNNSGGIAFQPHKDKAQAFEVLEWLAENRDWNPVVVHDAGIGWWCDGSVSSGDEISTTLQEAITLAAIELLNEPNKGG